MTRKMTSTETDDRTLVCHEDVAVVVGLINTFLSHLFLSSKMTTETIDTVVFGWHWNVATRTLCPFIYSRCKYSTYSTLLLILCHGQGDDDDDEMLRRPCKRMWMSDANSSNDLECFTYNVALLRSRINVKQ